jgi:hypothetical protein
MQNRIATLKHAGMQQLCARTSHWAVMEFRMGQNRHSTEHDARHGFKGAPFLSPDRAGAGSKRLPHCWSTHDKMDVAVARSGVPQFSDLVQV